MLKRVWGNLKSITQGIFDKEINEHGHCCDSGDCAGNCDTLENNRE